MSEKKRIIKVWTDGACFPNPGRGGWAWTTLDGRQSSGSLNPTTNNVMEILGVLNAVRELYQEDTQLIVYSDSQYVVKGITEWVRRWERNGWRTKGKKKEPVKNKELWMELRGLTKDRNIMFEWVQGHSGDLGNEEADRLATEASGVDQRLIEQFRKKWE